MFVLGGAVEERIGGIAKGSPELEGWIITWRDSSIYLFVICAFF